MEKAKRQVAAGVDTDMAGRLQRGNRPAQSDLTDRRGRWGYQPHPPFVTSRLHFLGSSAPRPNQTPALRIRLAGRTGRLAKRRRLQGLSRISLVCVAAVRE